MSDTRDFLAVMARAAEARALGLADGDVGGALERRALDAPPPPRLRLSGQGFDVIAEIKMSSPSAGTLSRDGGAIEDRAMTYGGAGACAVSVLTEPDRFGGSLEHLRRVAGTLDPLGVPAMAKDFIVAPEQVWAARAEGAGGILLIIRMLDDSRLAGLLDLALGLSMFVLLEAFDGPDLDRADGLAGGRLAAGSPVLMGLNCRDLRTLSVDPGRFRSLSGCLPPRFPTVAESGIETPADAAEVRSCGYSMALVGTALMRSADPAGLLGEMLLAGRAAGSLQP